MYNILESFEWPHSFVIIRPQASSWSVAMQAQGAPGIGSARDNSSPISIMVLEQLSLAGRRLGPSRRINAVPGPSA